MVAKNIPKGTLPNAVSDIQNKAAFGKLDGWASGYLKGAGVGVAPTGIEFPYFGEKIPFYNHDGSTFDSISSAVTGSGSVEQAVFNTLINTGATSDSTARQYHTYDSWQLSPLLTNVHPFWMIQPLNSASNVEIWVVMTAEGIGYPTLAGGKVGFIFEDGTMYAHCANGTDNNKTGIGSYTDSALYLLEARSVASTIQYYVNGVLKTTHNMYLPSHQGYRAMIAIKNKEAATKRLSLLTLSVVSKQ